MKQEYTAATDTPENVRIQAITTEQVWQWLAVAWGDIQRAPLQSLFYGVSLALLSVMVSLGVIISGAFYLLPPLLGGFLLVAPFLGVGPYSISQQLERGDRPNLRTACLVCTRNTLQIFNMGLVLLLCFVVWGVLAGLIFFFFHDGPFPSDWQGYIAVVLGSWEGLQILAVGTYVGGMLAILVFALSAISIPMLMDRPVNVLVAIRTSWNAVRYNAVPMLLWGGILVTIIGAGFLTGYLGFIIGFPLAAHGTWHAYRDLVAADKAGPE